MTSQPRRPEAGPSGDPRVAALLDTASRALGSTLLADGGIFPGSRRSVVVRARDASGAAVIAKGYPSDDGPEAYAREAAALAALSTLFAQAVPDVPILLAESTDPPVVVMSDLGDGRHLATDLLGPDAATATDSLSAWATSLGRLHVAGLPLRDQFVSGLAERAVRPTDADYLPGQLGEAAEVWPRLASRLGVDVPQGAFDPLVEVPGRFRIDAPSLSAADVCPDNNVIDGGRVALLDFEFATWRHVAWDAAYLSVPWPTCWCAWSLEAAAASLALDRWRGVLAEAVPAAAGRDFDHDLALAAEGWAWLAGSWCVAAVLDDGPPASNPAKPQPRSADRALRFLRTAAVGEALPELAAFAEALIPPLVERYAAHDVPPAPAFARGESP